MNHDAVFQMILMLALLVLALFILIAILRSVIGPRVADRIIAVNMIGTMTMVIIAILAVYLGEDYLTDVCLVYAMMSFLAVVVVTKIYTGIAREKRLEKKEEQEETHD